MKLDELFPGSFRKEDFTDNPTTLTIKSVTPIVFEENGEQEQKGKMTFVETPNYWVFGREAAGELAEQIGSGETDDWIGHRITLRNEPTVSFRGRPGGIRGSFADLEPRRPMGVPALEAEQEREPTLEELERQLQEKRARMTQQGIVQGTEVPVER